MKKNYRPRDDYPSEYDNEIDLKKESLKIGLGILYILFILFIMRYFQLGRWGVIGLLCLGTTAFQLYSFIKKRHSFNLWGLFKSWLVITLIIHFYALLGRFKWLGFFGTCLIIAGLILWRKRKQFLGVKHRIEKMLWGKPLYVYRKDGKKPPKIEIIK